MTVTWSYLGYFFSYIPIYLFYILQLPGPTCLFYQRDNGDLVPVAIQLMPEPAEDNPVGITFKLFLLNIFNMVHPNSGCCYIFGIMCTYHNIRACMCM